MSWEELAGSPRYTLSKSGSSCTRRFVCAWGSHLALVDSLTDATTLDIANLYCKQITFESWSQESAPDPIVIASPTLQQNSFTLNGLCLVEAQYELDYYNVTWPSDIPKPSHRAGTTLRLAVRQSGEFMTAPLRGFKWEQESLADDPVKVPLDLNARIVIPMREFTVTWDYVADPPLDRFRAILGSCNDDTYMGCEIGTLLFEGHDMQDSLQVHRINPFRYRLQIPFRQRRIWAGSAVAGWNHELRDNPFGWVKLKTADGANRYSEDDFSGLFL